MTPPADAWIETQAAKWKPVHMPARLERFSERERRIIAKLVEAGQQMEWIFWQQSDPEGLRLMRSTGTPLLARFLQINGGRWDLLENHRPFAGAPALQEGRQMFPPGATRAEIEAYARRHPEQKPAVYSGFTVVRREGAELETVPYSAVWREPLEKAASALREAATFSEDPAFARFLRLRAEALLHDDYYASDLAWMDLENPRFDAVIGPYETYLDDLLGVKTSFSFALLIRDEEESRRLSLYQRHVAAIQDALPLPAEDRPSKQGHLTPMEVVESPFRTGDFAHGYQAVATNLPNDPRVHAAKGTKKIFFRNFMDARVKEVILPLARRLMRPNQAAKVTGEGYLAGTVLHEIAHGLGPAYARRGGGQMDIREAVGPIYSALEEAKADCAGMFGLQWLMDKGALPASRAEEFYASQLAGLFRTLRYGVAEAHGRAEMMEFNFLSERGAVRREGGRWVADFGRMRTAYAELAKELLETEAAGDRDRAERWFGKYDRMPAELAADLDAVKEVPVDVHPSFDFPLLPGEPAR